MPRRYDLGGVEHVPPGKREHISRSRIALGAVRAANSLSRAGSTNKDSELRAPIEIKFVKPKHHVCLFQRQTHSHASWRPEYCDIPRLDINILHSACVHSHHRKTA